MTNRSRSINTRTFKAEKDIWELFLLNLRYKQADQIEIGGRNTILLTDPNALWMVYTGEVDVFSVRLENGQPVGTRNYLFTAPTGHIMVGNAHHHDANALLLSGNRGTQLLHLTPGTLHEAVKTQPNYQPIMVYLIEKWTQRLSDSFSDSLPPRDFITLDANGTHTIPDAGVAKPVKRLIWLQLQTGAMTLTNLSDTPIEPSDRWLPITARQWMVAEGDTEIMTKRTTDLFSDQTIWQHLDNYQSWIMGVLGARTQTYISHDEERLREKQIAINDQLGKAIDYLAAPLMGTTQDDLWSYSPHPLLAACEIVAEQLNIEITPPQHADNLATLTPTDAVQYMARSSHFRTRRVALRGDWWKQDNGAMLGFLGDDKIPVALVMASPRQYEMVNPMDHSRTMITADVAETLDDFAEVFYRPFPYKTLNLRDLVTFGLSGLRRDITTVLIASLFLGILQVLTPLLGQLVFDSIVPAGNQTALLYVAAALLGASIGSLLLNVTYSVAILRIENRFEANLQTAMWDRLLELPIDFFQQFSSGDLASRAASLSAIRTVITTTFLTSLLPAIYGVANLVMLFVFSPVLASVAIILAAIAIAAMVWVSNRHVKLQRDIADIQGETYGHVLQLVNGIAKFRVAAAESFAFLTWAQRFAKQRDLSFRARTLQNSLTVFTAFYPPFTQAVIFGLLIMTDSGISTGTFLAFNIAFTVFLSSMLALGGGVMAIFSVIPMYERAQPILETLPEVDHLKTDPGPLSGTIEVQHVTFQYDEGGATVLDDVSLKAEPGQFIAIVGESGSGKSTLMRLLLGFHKPKTGVIYYDNLDLAQLDIKSVRRQVGVVLQNSELTAGQDIFRNIVGSSGLTMDDAWNAAERAGLADDIRQMPMGMATLVSTGGGTLSGGQRQRVLIARALVRKPRIVFFDEATSALDNRTQAVVSESLEQMEATRIVIAHRLSTIINADKIFVMDNGRVIEQGNYKELMALDEHFAELAKRQLA